MKSTKTNAKETFGSYLRFLLNKYGQTARELARLLHFTPPYISDVLAGNNKPLKFADLKKIETWLSLSSNEAEHLYDLAGQERNEIAPDLMALIRNTQEARNLLRIIKRNKISGKRLQQICTTLSSKGWK